MTKPKMTNDEKTSIAKLSGDLIPLFILAALNIVIHTIFNNNYGFHRDELATFDDAHNLAWGYVAYPPVTPFIGRAASTLFGSSLIGLRLFPVLATSAAMILGGLMARALGGGRFAQFVSAAAVGIAPIVIIQGSLFQYVSFDYLWWVTIGFMMIMLLKTENPRWWLGIGALIGIGLMTKYTIALLVIGLVVSVILTKSRNYLKSPWLWAGVGISLLIWLPNIIWQAQHDFISVDFLKSIHERDVRIGRASGFIPEQFLLCTNLVTVPLWIAGLWFYIRHPLGAKFRAMIWMFIVPLALFILMKGRSYYMAPAYPILFAGGSVLFERWTNSTVRLGRPLRIVVLSLFLISGTVFSLLLIPIPPVNSALWDKTASMHDNFTEEIGWTDLVETTANIYNSLPAEEKANTGILAGNYGEAGAVNLYGANYGLPKAISLTNSYWIRGYGNPPQQVILLGFSEKWADALFENCRVVGEVTNSYGVINEETRDHKYIRLCRGARLPWDELWVKYREFG